MREDEARPPEESERPTLPLRAGEETLEQAVRPDADSHYDIGPEIARGGMGRIRRAWDRRLGRPVAIKELLVSDAALTKRFQREAAITARLQHPGIVSVYDAGCMPGGEPFYAMRLVAGRSLSAAMASCATLDERLGLLPNVLSVAEALAYAHEQRVVHRDLKPENVIVGHFGETVVIDWGLAKDLARDDGDEAGPSPSPRAARLTEAGEIMGTPASMAPEQAMGKPVDERADVYAIGAILYHLIVGAAPYRGTTSHDVLHQVLAGPPPPAAERQPAAPRDLAAIVDRAMAREPTDRYPSGAELAAELRRFLTGQLVASHRYTRRELTARWLRRHRGAVMVAVASALVLAVAMVGSVRRIVEERDAARAHERRARMQADELTVAFAHDWLTSDPLMSLAALKKLSPESPQWAKARVIVQEALSGGVPEVYSCGTRPWELTTTQDGRFIAVAGWDGTVQLIDTVSHQMRILENAGTTSASVRFAPGESELYVASGSSLRAHALRDEGSRVIRTLSPDVDRLAGSAFTQDGCRLLFPTVDALHVRETASEGLGAVAIAPSPAGPISDVTIDPSGRLAAAFGHVFGGSGIWVWDTAQGTAVNLPEEPEQIDPHVTYSRLAWSHDGHLLAVEQGRSLLLWDWPARAPRRLPGLERGGDAVVFSPDATVLAAADRRVVRQWHLEEQDWVETLAGHERDVTRLAIAPDGTVASGAEDGTVRVWSPRGDERVLRGSKSAICGLAFTAGGERLIVAAGDGEVRVFPMSRGYRVLSRHASESMRIAKAAGRDVVAYMEDDSLWTWDLSDPSRPRLSTRCASLSRTLALSGDGSRVAHEDRKSSSVRVSDLRSEDGVSLPGGYFCGMSWDGGRIATLADGVACVWDVATQRPLLGPLIVGSRRVEQGRPYVAAAAVLSANGRRLATWGEGTSLFDVDSGARQALAGASSRTTARHWAQESGSRFVAAVHAGLEVVDLERTEVHRLADRNARGLTFSPDGRLLAAAFPDIPARLWELPGGMRRELRGSQGAVTVTFSPDGTWVAAGGTRGSVMLWDLSSDYQMDLEGHVDAVWGTVFLGDGSTLLSTGVDGTVRLWPLDALVAGPRELRSIVDRATHVTLDASGQARKRL